MLADWPGLATGQLYEARELKPTTGVGALIAAAVAEHLAVDSSRALSAFFPRASTGVRPVERLLRA